MPNVIGIFEDSSQAQQAVQRMKKDHIDGNRIDIVAQAADRKTDKSGLRGTLIGMGVPDEEASSYESQVSQGNVLVTVQAENSSEADRIANLMEVGGAVDVEGAGETGNAEAAPEYEGARSEESGETSDPQKKSAKPATRAARIRVYGVNK